MRSLLRSFTLDDLSLELWCRRRRIGGILASTTRRRSAVKWSNIGIDCNKNDNHPSSRQELRMIQYRFYLNFQSTTSLILISQRLVYFLRRRLTEANAPHRVCKYRPTLISACTNISSNTEQQLHAHTSMCSVRASSSACCSMLCACFMRQNCCTLPTVPSNARAARTQHQQQPAAAANKRNPARMPAVGRRAHVSRSKCTLFSC